MMHPMFKTAFLRSMGWPEEWIENVKMIVQNIWEKNYQKKTQEPEAPSQTDSLHEIDDWRYNNGSENDALQTYLALEPVLRCEDPIEYWVSQQNTQIVPAPLAQMALEYLGAPGVYFFIFCLYTDF
ncbi:hypothetical protein SISNIDRAFT_228238 [Sistotremastrum niveocremeum HHB9708]|uniref:HAT C-terminal dimerisation domain-containing protein n=1 Tax=Sistotremastrum niveocremeum HHB9708 TaxID=1314777 RepID=A0A164Q4Q6_9AGAM|nr:hypothetical protein SISNIDRAFT_228238 [Sistotremastrum niveocremeum HHB9708]